MEVLDVLPGNAVSDVTIAGSSVERVPATVTSPRLPRPTRAKSKHGPWAGLGTGSTAKRRRDYKEADRIRDLLKAAGWEVRDNKDGTVEVRRA